MQLVALDLSPLDLLKQGEVLLSLRDPGVDGTLLGHQKVLLFHVEHRSVGYPDLLLEILDDPTVLGQLPVELTEPVFEQKEDIERCDEVQDEF